MFRPRLALCAALLLLCTLAAADPAILVDHLHGYQDLDRLQSLWPDAEFTVLGPQDHPVQTVLAEGVAYQDEEIVVTVPAGQDCLYGYFLCDGGMVQHPFILVRDPSGATRADGFCGGFHVENPAAGDWTILFDDWEPELRHYVIGTGPHLLTAELMAGYDAVVRIWDETMLMFYGEMPEYSPRETMAVQDYLAAGGAHLFLREPLVEMALKPVIDLTAPVDMECDLHIGLPGRLTYAHPEADESGGVATWSDIQITGGATTQLLYEVAMTPPHHHLRVATADGLGLENRTDSPLREVMLVRHLGGDRWLLADGGDLAPRSRRTLPAARELNLAELDASLTRTMHRGGLDAGLDAPQMTRFQQRYHWVDRLVLEATDRGGWTALYRVEADLCDALLPLATDPPAAHRTRTLWFWLADIPDGLTGDEPWPATPQSPPVATQQAAASPLSVDEYGVIRQRYPVASPTKERDLTWLGWTFHDEFQLVDDNDNVGDPYLPLLDTPGGHPDAGELLQGLPSAIGGVTCGGVVAPDDQVLVRGDADTHTDDWFFAEGSYPPFVVGREVGEGRAAAVASRFIMQGGPDGNAIFLQRLMAWAQGTLTEGPEPLPRPGLQATAYPNPFNPGCTIAFRIDRAGPVTVSIHDATGRRVAGLFDGAVTAGQHELSWAGRNDRGQPVAAGMYLLRVATPGQTVGRKLTLVE